MLKLIVKNLWARRRRNGWLLAELILVSIVTWVIVDQVAVLVHDRNLPLGYDADRICLISLASLQPGAIGYSAQMSDSAALVDDYMRLIRKVKTHPDIKSATPLLGYLYLNSEGNSNTSYCVDSTEVTAMQIYFLPKTHFFETYGIQSLAGMTAEQLSAYDYMHNDIVMTKDLADNFYGSAVDARGKKCFNKIGDDAIGYPIIGVVKNVKPYSSWRPVPIVFIPSFSIEANDITTSAHILVRLKENTSMKRFLSDFHPWMVKEMKAGNLFARTVKSYDDIIESKEYTNGVTNKFRLNVALAIFFLVNLFFGVTGTFWLQTRVRREEVGVMLAFGGRPSHIVRLLMGEGVVLTAVAVLAGCLIYLQYAIREGIYKGECWIPIVDNGYWVSSFIPHFIVVSLLVFVILLCVVLLGIYIPARRISRIQPTEALRDE